MDFVMELVTSYLGDSGLAYVAAVVTIASTISALTPTPAPGSIWAKVYQAIDWLSLNIYRAKDKAEDVKKDVE